MPISDIKKGSRLVALDGTKANAPVTYPPLPPILPPEMQGDWESLISHLRAMDMWVVEKASVCENYLLNMHAMRQAYTAMQRDGGPISDDGRAHQASGVIARHSAAAQKCAIFLGLGQNTYAALEAKAKAEAYVTASVWGQG